MAVHLAHGAQNIVEDVVEADVTEAQLIHRQFQLGLTVGPDQRAGIVGPDREVEEAIHRCAGSGVKGDDTRGRCFGMNHLR
jgi:hypothetical protein